MMLSNVGVVGILEMVYGFLKAKQVAFLYELLHHI